MIFDQKINKELEMARIARAKGNEGMARVCARRAAGIAVREHLQRRNIDAPKLNNFEILSDENVRRNLPVEIVDHLNHLTMRVDENYTLPGEIDLLYDADMVIQLLSKEIYANMEENKKIVMYGTTWCSMTKRARKVFEEASIEYEWIDIDKDETAAKFVESVAKGYRSVPTIVFLDGSILVEPSSHQLKEKLGV